jgi:hypothetical protein
MADTTKTTAKSEIVVKFFAGSIEQSDAMLKAIGGVQERTIRSQQNDQRVEQRHAEQMKTIQLTPVREGRADTGDQVFGKYGLQNASLDSFVSDLTVAGMHVVQTKRERKPMRDRQTGEILSGKFRYVVEVYFSNRDDAAPIENANETARHLDAFCKGKLVQICHVWSNGGGHFTVNCTGGLQPTKPRTLNELRFDGRQIFNKKTDL